MRYRPTGRCRSPARVRRPSSPPCCSCRRTCRRGKVLPPCGQPPDEHLFHRASLMSLPTDLNAILTTATRMYILMLHFNFHTEWLDYVNYIVCTVISSHTRTHVRCIYTVSHKTQPATQDSNSDQYLPIFVFFASFFHK